MLVGKGMVGGFSHPNAMKPQTVEAIEIEIVKARTKFPKNAKLLAALMEEVGELAKALLQNKGADEVRKEAIQVACVAVRIIEEGDADFATGEWNEAP
jgi:NTP pyrophosphatase (non-canonical NTP hydrolase)